MIKRILNILPVFFFLPFLIISFPKTARAQEEPILNFERAYQDYIYTQNLYKQARGEFLLAQSQYTQAQTLASRTKLTIIFLEKRDDVVITYLTSLRTRLSEAKGLSRVDQENIFARLDSEVTWFQNHKTSIKTQGTLSDLENKSEDAKDQFTKTSQLAYETLATIPTGQTSLFRSSISGILSEIKAKTEEIRLNGDHNTAIAERWILETESKITASLDKEIAAQNLIHIIQTGGEDRRKPNFESLYISVVETLQESNQLLREANAFLREIIRELKTKQ